MVTITSGVVSDNALGDDAMGTTRLLILAANEGRPGQQGNETARDREHKLSLQVHSMYLTR